MEPSTLHQPDVQASLPTVHVSLSRVGVTGVEKVIRIGARPTRRSCSRRRLECFVDLGPRQKGAHMSRFEEVVNDAIGEVMLGESGFKAEALAQRIAERVRDRQDALRAEVTIAARYPEHKPAPVSGIQTQEIYTLYGSAVASATGTRRLVGVAAQGMTACPCAQQLVAGTARERLAGRGLRRRRRSSGSSRPSPSPRTTSAASARCTSAAPRTATTEIEAQTLLDDRRGLDVARDLRADEALRRGRRRREGPPPPALRRGLRARDGRAASSSASASCGDGTFVSARQENLETIHQHNVVAERFGLLGELRRELATGEHLAHHTSMREWLDAAGR